MKVLIDINKMYYEMLKHDVEVNHNDYLPCVLIARGAPLPEQEPKTGHWIETGSFDKLVNDREGKDGK